MLVPPQANLSYLKNSAQSLKNVIPAQASDRKAFSLKAGIHWQGISRGLYSGLPQNDWLYGLYCHHPWVRLRRMANYFEVLTVTDYNR
jgi:hypothetical protein